MKKDILLMKLVVSLLMVSSVSILFAIFADVDGNTANVIMAYAGAGLFWLTLIAGYVLLGVVSGHRKKYDNTQKYSQGHMKVSSRPGAFCFFSNKLAMIADIAMLASFVITLMFIFIPSFNQNVAVFFVAILIFSVHMHCILNGVNFRYIKSLINKGE